MTLVRHFHLDDPEKISRASKGNALSFIFSVIKGYLEHRMSLIADIKNKTKQKTNKQTKNKTKQKNKNKNKKPPPH